MRAMRSPRRFVGVIAGNQSGKTLLSPHWLLREIRTCGPGEYLVAGPTYALLRKKCIPEFLRLFKRDLNLGNLNVGAMEFHFSEEGTRRFFGSSRAGPTTVFFGHASNPDSLESATYKAAVLDEAGQAAFKLGSWEAIQRRLSINRGRCLVVTTPYNLGWLKTQWYDRWKNGDTDYDVIRFDSKDNPWFPIEEYERARRTLPAWKFNMFYRGMFERPAGQIYDCFNEDIHTIERFAIPDTWHRYLGMDFGGINTVGVFLAEEPIIKPGQKPRYFLYREYAGPKRTAKQHRDAIMAGELRMPWAVGGSKSEGQWRDEFKAAGLVIREPEVSEVEVGIDRVYSLFKDNRLVIFKDCVKVLDDIVSYSRVTDEVGNVKDEIEDKSSYHHCDALRAIATRLGRNLFPWASEGKIGVQPRSRTVVGSMPAGVFNT